MSGHGERPAGARPEGEGSGRTGPKLLTMNAALPRLESAIREVQAELAAATDQATRNTLIDRLGTMNAARDTFRIG